MFEGRETLWVVHIGKSERIALRARDAGFICIGWEAIGDLSSHDTREKMRKAMEKAYPDWKPGKVSASYGQVFRFAHEMAIGDPVVFPVKPTGEIAIGRVSGEYVSVSSDQELIAEGYVNMRKVEWLSIVPRTRFSKSALHSFGSFSSVSTSNDHLEEVIGITTTSIEIGEAADDVDVQSEVDSEDDEDATISNLYESAIQETEDYLLRSWRNTGAAFEHVVAAVFRALGYTTEVTPASGDHGIDVIAHPDPLGINPPYIKIQVKSGSSPVGEPQVNQLKGAVLENERGILITLGRFTSGAEAAARGKSNITLIEAKKFVALFIDLYEKLEPDWQARFPLRKTFVPLT